MGSDGRCIRAFRPSYFSLPDEYDEDSERTKEMNLRLYEERVQAGLPIFEAGPVIQFPNVDVPPSAAQG